MIIGMLELILLAAIVVFVALLVNAGKSAPAVMLFVVGAFGIVLVAGLFFLGLGVIYMRIEAGKESRVAQEQAIVETQLRDQPRLEEKEAALTDQKEPELDETKPSGVENPDTASPSAKAPTPSAAASQNKRPAWLDTSAGLQGGAYRTTVSVGPCATRRQGDHEMAEALRQATLHYVQNLPGVPMADRLEFSAEFIRSRYVKEQWEEQRDYSVGPMLHLHALLEFDDRAQQEIKQLGHDQLLAGRLWYTGTGAGAVLLALAGLFGFLKVTERSRDTGP